MYKLYKMTHDVVSGEWDYQYFDTLYKTTDLAIAAYKKYFYNEDNIFIMETCKHTGSCMCEPGDRMSIEEFLEYGF